MIEATTIRPLPGMRYKTRSGHEVCDVRYYPQNLPYCIIAKVNGIDGHVAFLRDGQANYDYTASPHDIIAEIGGDYSQKINK